MTHTHFTNYIKDMYGYDRPSLSVKTADNSYLPIVSSASQSAGDYTGVLKYLFAEELDQNQDGSKDGFANASIFASEADINNFKTQVEKFVDNLDIDALVDAGYDRDYLNNLMEQFLDFDNKSILQLNDKSKSIQNFIKDIKGYVNSTKDIINTTERENEILATAQDIWQLNDFYIFLNQVNQLQIFLQVLKFFPKLVIVYVYLLEKVMHNHQVLIN